MRTKQLLVSLTLAVFSISLICSSALAGSKQRHRWEGVAIGVGAAILGHAIYQQHRTVESPPRVAYAEPAPAYGHRQGKRYRHGHWEWQKTWVPPTYERVWNPGHYNRKGRWVEGHWINLQRTEGNWCQERVWMGSNHRPY